MLQRLRIRAYAILLQENRILLCRLAPHLGVRQQWSLPGGGLDFGEHPIDAVVREVFEEAGLNIRVQGNPVVDSEVFVLPDCHMQAIRLIYAGTVTGGVLTHELNGSTDRCEWFTYEETLALPLVSLASLGLRLAFPDVAK